MTIVSTDDDDQSTGPGAANQTDDKPDKTAEEKPLDLISEMYAVLRACWTPPPKDEGRHGSGSAETSHHTRGDHIGGDEANHGNGLGRLLCGKRRGITDAKNNVRVGFG